MKSGKRAILIVADGFGVGAMEDCAQVRPTSVGANSLRHVMEKEDCCFQYFEELGIGNLIGKDCETSLKGFRGVGKCALAHYGADSYEGHNEIMGNHPKMPLKQTMADVGDEVKAALLDKGYDVFRVPESTVLIVNDAVAVADNMETDPGQVINVSGCLDIIPFETILDIGWTVRSIVKTNRVITLGGIRITEKDLEESIIKAGGSCGLDTRKLDIYNDSYKVCHMGYGVNPVNQAQMILKEMGIPVYLLGKMADVIDGQVDYRKSMVHTEDILAEIKQLVAEREPGFISATCQQTDLAGHMGDSKKYAHVLSLIDEFIPQLIEMLDDGDMILITGDHGNDPVCCGSAHSREYTPFLVYIKDKAYRHIAELGTRDTLADCAATICEFYSARNPEGGKSALSELYNDNIGGTV